MTNTSSRGHYPLWLLERAAQEPGRSLGAGWTPRPNIGRYGLPSKVLAHGPTDDLMVESVERSFGGTKLETDMPRLARPSDLASFRSPVLVIAAEHDPLFPPARVLPAARALFPNLVSATVLRGSGHIMSPDAATRLSARLQEFFTAG